MRIFPGHKLPLIGLISFLSIAVYGQTAPAEKAPATIAGRITLDSKEAAGVVILLTPDAGGHVSFGGERAPGLSAVSDPEGRYRLTNIPPGGYRLTAFGPAYVVEGEGDLFRPGKMVNLAEGEHVEGLDMSLTRGGVITGRVTDEDGRGVIGEPVRVYKLGPDGQPISETGMGAMFARWETDDRGVYRIFGLEPGKYLVAAGGAAIGSVPYFGGDGGGYYLQTFYPGTVEDAQARLVVVKGGEEAGEVDIKIVSPAKGFTVTGRVVDAETGDPVPGVTIKYSTSSVGKSGSRIQTAVTYSQGSQVAVSNSLGEFRFEGLRPKSYRFFIVNPQGGDADGGQVESDVVDGDVNGLEIKAQQANVARAQRLVGTISGRIAADDGRLIPQAKVQITPLDPWRRGRSGGVSAVIDKEGNFQAEGLDAAPYTIAVVAPGYVLQPQIQAQSQAGDARRSASYYYLGDAATLTMI
jgi:protocatechuate 3,4-dioxygenase beta subunit